MIRIFATVLAALAGLAFGSFLNVCLTRWPAGESVVKPRSHCRACNRALAWWENVPLLSWLALRGHCRTCSAKISWRYPLVELLIGLLWAVVVWEVLAPASLNQLLFANSLAGPVVLVGRLIFYWLIVALAILDAEHFWLPNSLTFPGIILGLIVSFIQTVITERWPLMGRSSLGALLYLILGTLIAAGLILLIRWIYWLVRRQEGIGMGDAKLMALLAAWLGLPGAIFAFVVGVVLGAVFALIVLALPRRGSEPWATMKLPLGTFLCIGGIISALWGSEILTAYLRWSGLS